MSVPAYIPMLDLNNHLELGPPCPPSGRCLTCKEHHWCRYEAPRGEDTTRWMERSREMFERLLDPKLTGFKRMVEAVTLAQYLMHHRGYYRLADTLLYLADNVTRKETT